ncbi:MAG: cupin domain protein [uncultured archaeon A07HB70]|jgi:Mannose-6-phosphate isomerase|nr:MAG: cupin domain protein [uncultured archaeon A07HB70]
MDVIPVSAERTTEVLDGVHLAQAAAGERASVQHFRIEPGATVDRHAHENEQLGWLAAGSLVFRLDGETVTVEAGDSYAIGGGERHGAHNRGDEDAVGVEVFVPPRESPPWE